MDKHKERKTNIIEICRILDIFKPTKIRSISNSTNEINEQSEIKPISVIRLKSTNTKEQQPIVIELDYTYQAQEMLKASKKLS